jgi:predicted Zn-dependent protease
MPRLKGPRVPHATLTGWRPAFAAAALLASAIACATNPVTGKKEFSLMSEAQEIDIGRQLDTEVRREMGLYEDAELQRYVSDIGLRLARHSQRPNLPWQFAVVDSPAVNAFALPGGFIYLTRGIMPFLDDEAELAGVLGHEIGHVTARHAAQQYSRATGAQLGLILGGIFFPATRPFGQIAETGLGLLFLKHGRDDELQADRLGAEYAMTGGWDPAGVPGLLNTLARIDEGSDRRGIPNWLSTHPHPADRVEKVSETVQQLRAKGGERLTVDRDQFLRRIDGIVFGDNPEEGIVRGNAFLHPQLRFALTFPQGWEINNGKTQVLAKAPGDELYMLLQLVQDPQGRSIQEVAVRGMQQAGFRPIEGGATQINGLDAHVGTYRGNLEGLGTVVTRAAHVAHGRNIFVLAGIAKQGQYAAGVEREFVDSIRSFRPLSRAEAAEVRPNRVDLYVVRSGDTWQSIAQRAGEGNVKAATLAIMNNSAPNAQPRPGDRIKIVVAG